MKDSSKEKQRFCSFVGYILILVGIVCNQWTLTALLSADGKINLPKVILIWFFDIVCVLLGYLLVKRPPIAALAHKCANAYQTVATLLLSTTLLFVLANVAVYVVHSIKGLPHTNVVRTQYGQLLDTVYSDMDPAAVNLMLAETYTRKYPYEPYTQFREGAYSGTYVNVHETGFRLSMNQGVWPPDESNYNIFVFGGSTTFGYGVSDHQTIPSHLQEHFATSTTSKPVRVYNFGTGWFVSSQERILYEKLLSGGFVPDAAVFIDGFNDFAERLTEPEFTSRLRLAMHSSYELVQHAINSMPIVQVAHGARGQSHAKPPADLSTTSNDQDAQAHVAAIIERYRANKKIIEAVSTAFGSKSVFVWQPVPEYKYDVQYNPFAEEGHPDHMWAAYGYPIVAEIYRKGDFGNNFLWLADMQQDVKRPLYVDGSHYSSEMCDMIAERIHLFMSKPVLAEAK